MARGEKTCDSLQENLRGLRFYGCPTARPAVLETGRMRVSGTIPEGSGKMRNVVNPPSKTGSSAGRPLCLNQEQLLFSREWMEQNGESASPSLISAALSLRGTLHEKALEQALNEIVRRHPALRAHFYPMPEIRTAERSWRLRQFGRGVYVPGLYRQCVSSVDVPLRRVDLMHLGPDQAVQALESLMREEAAQPFDLAQSPRLRAALLALGPEHHLLIVVVDHAVADAWSMRILRKELVALYDRFCGDTQRFLAEPGLSFPDYAAWESQALASSELASAVSHWKQQWERYGSARIAYEDLPFANPVMQQPLRGFVVERALVDPAVCDAIRRFARLSRVSMNMFFFASYAAVLQSYTRKPRLALWCHFANRSRPEVQNSIGYFVHRHLIGLDFPPELSGAELLWQTRKAILDAYEHQLMPLAHVWHSMNRWPRFADTRVLVDYYQADELWEDWQLASGLQIRRVALPGVLSPRFSSLGMYVRDSREGMSLEVQYSQDRFPQTSVRHLLDDVQSVITHLLSHPDTKVSDFFSAPRYGTVARPSKRMGEFVGLSAREGSARPEVENV